MLGGHASVCAYVQILGVRRQGSVASPRACEKTTLSPLSTSAVCARVCVCARCRPLSCVRMCACVCVYADNVIGVAGAVDMASVLKRQRSLTYINLAGMPCVCVCLPASVVVVCVCVGVCRERDGCAGLCCHHRRPRQECLPPNRHPRRYTPTHTHTHGALPCTPFVSVRVCVRVQGTKSATTAASCCVTHSPSSSL